MKPLTPERAQELIDEIMDSFDFGAVAVMMKATNWCWGGSKEPPLEPEIRRRARTLMKELVDSNGKFLSTGGFTVMRQDDSLTLYWGLEWTAGED